MGGTVMGRGAILIVVAGAYGPAAVVVAASVENAEREADRLRRADLEALDEPGAARPLGLLRDHGEIVVCGVDFGREEIERLRQPVDRLPALKDHRQRWVAMNDRHQRRAGLRSSRIPRVICPA